MAAFALLTGCLIVGYTQRTSAQSGMNCQPEEPKEVQIYRKLIKRDPKDLQARIFLAWVLMDGYDDDGQPNAGQKEALAIFETVLQEDPENSAANHYWIHAVEASPHPERALHSAELLARLAPTSGHRQYMQGQNVQVDDWN